MEQSPEELGDLYLDVSEAFMEEGEYNSALPLLSALVCSERYNLAVVWLRHAGYYKPSQSNMLRKELVSKHKIHILPENRPHRRRAID